MQAEQQVTAISERDNWLTLQLDMLWREKLPTVRETVQIVEALLDAT